jgi:hypothetical protein
MLETARGCDDPRCLYGARGGGGGRHGGGGGGHGGGHRGGGGGHHGGGRRGGWKEYTYWVDDVIDPFWGFETSPTFYNPGMRPRRFATREGCLASVTNTCSSLYDYGADGYQMCVLGAQSKQGQLPDMVRAETAALAYDITEENGGLAFAIGYRMPLCSLR